MSANYFISTSGSSGNSGLSALLPKNSYANALSGSGAGDTFSGKGGDTFRQSVLARAANQTFNAYGTGKPIITGADVVGPFTAATAPRYSAAVSTQPNIIFVNNVRATRGASATSLNDGEWWWAGGALYYRSDAGNPTTLGLVIEAGQRNYPFTSGSFSGFTLTSLCLQGGNADESGAYLTFAPSGYLIDGCTIQDNYGAGVHINGTSTSGTVQNSEIARNGLDGIYWSHPQNLLSNALGNNIHDNGWRTDGGADFSAGIRGSVQSGEWGFNTVTSNGSGSQLVANAHGMYLVIGVTSCTLWIHDNDSSLHVNGDGIKADSSCHISYNLSHENVWQGAELGFNTAQNVLILLDHNVFYLNGRSAVSCQRGSSGTGTLTIHGYHNTCYHDCTVSAEELSIVNDFTALDWRNNITVASSTANFIKTYAGFTGTKTVDYNCYSGGNATPFRWGGLTQAFAAYKTSTGFDAHSINADPTFTNAGAHDFTLQSGSPAIDAGVHISGIDDGYVGSAPDMGANEADFSGGITGSGATAMHGVDVAGTGTTAGAGAGGSTLAGLEVAGTGSVSLSATGTAATTLGGVRVAGSGTVAGTTVIDGTPLASPFLFPPNWETAVEMTSTWKTDVLQGEDGTEQRVSMRDGPADSMKYAARIQSQADAGALALLLGLEPTGRFNMPRWADASLLTADVSIGGTSISCDTTDRAFTVGGTALIWRAATGVAEVRLIAGISDSALDLTGDPATLAWTGNTDVEVLPIAPAWLTLPLGRTYVGGVLAEVQVACEWEVAQLPSIGPTASVPVTVAIGADAITSSGAISYANIFLVGSYLVVHAEVLDADDVEIPEAPVVWTLDDAVNFSIQPVGLFGETAILKNVSATLSDTATLTATSGAASGSRTVGV